MKINVFHALCAFRLKMYVRCKKTVENWPGGGGGSAGGINLGQSMLFEGVGICVFSPAHECGMRGTPVYLLIVKYLAILFKFSHSILDWTALSWI